MIDNYRSNYQDDRVYGRIEMSYEIMKGLKATGRLGGDFSNNRTNSQEPKTTSPMALTVSLVELRSH